MTLYTLFTLNTSQNSYIPLQWSLHLSSSTHPITPLTASLCTLPLPHFASNINLLTNRWTGQPYSPLRGFIKILLFGFWSQGFWSNRPWVWLASLYLWKPERAVLAVLGMTLRPAWWADKCTCILAYLRLPMQQQQTHLTLESLIIASSECIIINSSLEWGLDQRMEKALMAHLLFASSSGVSNKMFHLLLILNIIYKTVSHISENTFLTHRTETCV